MSMLSPKSLAEVLPIMGGALDLDVAQDRPEIILYINRFRNLLYNLYEEFKLFDNVFHCIRVSDFRNNCLDKCNQCYQAITLPPDVAAVEAMWDYGRPLTLHSRWRESHNGVGFEGCSRISTIEMGELFPTERDVTVDSSLKIFTEREEDEDKCVHITVVTCAGKETTLVFKLIGDGWAVSKTKIKKIISVVLPSGRAGNVRLAQSDGYILSEYAPWETIPAYRRFKVNERCCRGTVLVQGTKAFRDIAFDHDIVEVGDRLVIEAAAKYFKFGENTADGNEIAVSDKWRNEMRVMLNGLISRNRGNAIQDANPMQLYRVRRKTLPGYRK